MDFITFSKNKLEDPAGKSWLFLLFTVFSMFTAFGQCPPGNVHLATQAQINQFAIDYPNCTTITGFLTVGQTATHLTSPDIVDISPLNGITHVTGNFFLGRTQNLAQANLNNLQQVGGTFDLGTGMTALTAASFNAITTIGGAFSLSVPNLTSLSGMNNLTSVGGHMHFNGISSNPTLPAFTSLTTITGNLFFQNTGLTSISGFPALQTLGGNFQVAQNSGFVQTISGFGSLTQIGGIVIGNASAANANMKSFQIGGASPITVTGNVSLEANGNGSPEFLINGLSLGNITSVGGNISLASIKPSTITGFQNLQTVGGGISVSGASNLTTLDFGNLSGAMSGILNITGSPALTSITGLSGVTSVGGNFNIAPGGSALTQLSIPGNLTSVGGYFNIAGTGLTSISGFNSLQSINGNFSVISNSALTQISGFNNLTSINGNFVIGAQNQLNPALTQISGFGSLNHLGGNFDIFGNGQLQTVNLSGSTIGTVNGYLRLASNGNNLSTVNLGNITAVAGTSPNNYLWLQNIAASAITGLNLNSVGGNVNVNITSLTSLPFSNSLTSISGNLSIASNPALTSSGLGHLTSVNGNLTINQNAGLTSLSGLSNLATVSGNLVIQQNNGLTSLSGLGSLTSVGGNLDLNSNTVLASLSALNNLTSINGMLRVLGTNNQLSSLDGLQNITGINNLIVQNNSNLSVCSLSNLCLYLSNPTETHPRIISNNKLGSDCVNVAAVIAACPPLCNAPTNLTASNVSANSAVLGWTSAGNLFDLQWGTQGFALNSGTTVSNIATTSHTLSSLAANTQYEFYVRQNCSGSESNWVGPFGFSTLQFGAALHFDGVNDYTETTSPTNLPLGNAARTVEVWVKVGTIGNWRSIVNYGATANSQRFGILIDNSGRPYFVGENNDMTGTVAINDNNWHHIAVTYTGGTNGTVAMYVDGVLNISSTKTLNTSNGKLRMGRRVDGGANFEYFNGTIDEVRIWNYALTQCEIQTRKNDEVNPSTNGLVSYYKFNQGSAAGNNASIASVTDLTGNNNGQMYNFALSGATSNFVAPGAVTSGVNAPEVEMPNNLSVNDLTADSATLGWTSSGSLFDIQWGIQDFTLGSGTTISNIEGNSYTLSELNFNTQYGFYIRQHCTIGGKTNWVGPFEFTTSIPCFAPTNLTASNVTISSANLGWTSSGSSFDIQYGTADFTLGNGIIVNNITSTSYSLSGLSYNTTYQFYVRQICQENQSGWAGPYSFSTPTFCPPGSYTLKTQAEVDGFLTVNPGCTTITGDLVIGHNNITYGNTNITDLSPLAGITHITGNLIIRRNYNIQAINLPNLTEVGGNIMIWEETVLKTISLPALTTVGGHINLNTIPVLETISGLNNLTTVGGAIHFQQLRQTNPAPAPNSLTLPAFSSLQSIGGNLTFLNIYGLSSYTNAFPNLQTINGTLTVSINGNGANALQTLTGFNSLTSVGAINVSTNQSALQTFAFLGNSPISVTGDVNFQNNNQSIITLNLGNITSVGGNANFGNLQATQLSGFKPVTIGGNLTIAGCTNLNTVSNFSNLTSIGGNLHFHYLLALNSFSAFENLTSVNGYIFLRQLGILTSLNGMQNIAASGITNLSIYQNPQLGMCELANFCTYLSNPNNPRTIFGNKAGGNCTNEATVMAICIPPCNEPMGLSATNLTANTASLGWNTSGNFDLEWGAAGFTLGNGTAVSGEGSSYNLSGLNPSTQYEFYVRQDCTANNLSNLSNWAGPFSFTTAGYCVPSPYVASQSYGIYINAFSTTGGVENLTNTNSGFSSGGYGDFSNLSVSQHIGESLSFTSVQGSASYPQGLRIWADWNKNGVFETSEIVYTAQNLASNGHTGSFIVPNVAEGSYRIRVIAKYDSNNIDSCETLFYGETEDYTITVLPALPCTAPTSLFASDIAVNTANLSWGSVANAQSYNWVVVTSGANPNETAVISGNTTATTVPISGLSMETAYDFYVKSDCSTDGQSKWSAPYGFTTQGAPYRFVKPVASGTGDGSSWANASNDLQAMINGNGTVEVWVASGTYKPIRLAHNLGTIDQDNRDNAFVLKNNVKVYGGFTGTESNVAERNFSQNISILSGDFNNNGIADNSDAYHVVVIAGNLGTATLDGFTITGGNANGSGNITVNSKNISRAHSGGINIVQSPITLRNLTVTGNNGQYGGGIFLINSPAFINNTFVNNNTAQSGAGIKFDNSAVNLTNVSVTGNLAGTYGGGIDIYGTPSPTLTNVTVSGNVAQTGGGICTNLSSPIIRNSLIYGNNTGLENLTPAYTVTHSNSLVEGVTTNSNGNIEGSIDPMFTDMPDFNTAPFAGGNFSLQLCSPVINKGNNTHITGNSYDITGNSRVFNGTVDLGAFEVQEGSAPITDLYASGLHTTTVTLGWDSEGSLFDLEWGTAGFTQGNGTLVTGLTVNSYTLTNLAFDTQYEFYVRENCGGNQSEWSVPFAFTPVYSICPLGYLSFTSQAQINDFGATYSTCNVTTGHLVISGNDITNLSPLQNIVEVGGNFYAHNNPLLANFNGLQNIKSIGGYIRIHNNTALASISALTLNEQPNGVLDSYLLIENNPALTSLGQQNVNGLGKITEITSYLRIHGNPALASIDALSGLTGIGTSTATTLTYRGVSVHGTAISSISAFSNLTQINAELNISDNPNLTSLQGLNGITSIAGFLRIYNNGLTNLDGLANLTSIGGNLTIDGPALTSVTGLSNLSGPINGHLRIEDTALTSLNGLQGITAVVGNQLFIGYNPNLTDITALENADLGNTTMLTVRNNTALADCTIFCDYLANDPATHPRYFTTNNGNCSNVANVVASCPAPIICPTGNLTFNTQAQLDQFKLDYPNCTEIAGHVLISGGLSVNNLDGLSNIQTINGGFSIWANHNLYSLAGLENLTTVASTFTVYNNKNLTNIDALENLTSVGVGMATAPAQSASHLVFQHNKELTNLNGLKNLTKFGGNLTIENNESLVDIDGLALISTGNTGNLLPNVIKSISVRNNASLVNLNALDHLTQIGYLYVIGNGALENLNGLSNVGRAVGSVTIFENPVLTDISGLAGLDINYIFGNAGGFNSGTGLIIKDNTLLSVCNLPTNLCMYLAGPKQRTLSGNQAGCADEAAAIASCQSCDLPLNPTVEPVTPYTVEFSWDAVNDAGSYNWIIIADNEDPETATPLFSGNTAETNITVSSIIPQTDYDFYVKTNCGGNQSNWSSRVDFFTEIICPSGNVFLTNQAEVDAFPATYAGCTTISGNLTIVGISSLSNITDLSPLNSITQVTGNLVIRNNGSGLVNLNGLSSVTEVGGNVEAMSNIGLTSLSGLEGLTAIDGYLQIIYNNALTSLSGLNNITTVGGHLTIFGNHSLTNLNGLNAVSSTGDYLNIGYNLGLTSLSGLENLTGLGGSLDVRHNASLTSISGLNNLATVGSDLRIWDNAVLENLNALTNITAINGYLHIQANPELSDISGLQNIDPATIGGSLGLYIIDNPELSVCDLANFCTYLIDSSNVRTISNNGEGCTETEVVAACTPVCDIPENITETLITSSSANFSWNNANGANGYSWVVVSSGANPDGTAVSSGNTSGATASVSGLVFATTYDFYVKANCTAIQSDWSGPYRFTTYSPDYATVELSGFNSDIIANGNGHPNGSTSHDIDGWYNVFYNQTYSYNGVYPYNYLPANGAFTSEQTAGLPYQLAPATGNNALRLTQGQSGTLVFTTPAPAKTVFALITSGGSSSAVKITVNFDDSTIQQFTNRTVSDWFNGNNYAIKGVGRVERTGYYFQDLNDNPRIYEIKLELDSENYSKNIASITFQRVSSGSAVTGVMGISIEKGIPILCPAPETVVLNSATFSTGNFSWNPIGNAEEYNWMIVPEGINPEGASPIASGTVSGTNASATGLNPEASYDFYVKANCGATDGESDWSKVNFATLSACPEGNLSFTTQQQIDDFIISYPYCTEIAGSVNISGADIINLDGLANVTGIGGNLEINNNPSLQYLDGLNSLVNLGGHLSISSNNSLTSLQGLQNINMNTVIHLYIQNNVILSACYNLPNICEYLHNGGAATISGNTGECINRNTVETSCPTIWKDNQWNIGEPDQNRNAIIEGNLTTSNNLTANNFTVNSGVFTLAPGTSLSVSGAITNNASENNFVVESGANLVQTNEATNTGKITVRRYSFPLYRQDYTLWASPVEEQNLRNFSPQTLYNRIYSYDTDAGTSGQYVQELFTTADVQNKLFNTGQGYLVRMPNNWYEYVNEAIPGVNYLGEFKGVPNNGNISIPISTANTAVNLVGNPYPSAILMDAFFNENPGIERTIYFWRKRNGVAGSGYATCTELGLASPQPGIDGLELNNILNVAQGFFVRSTGATTLNFNNSMRSSQNGLFLRSGSTIEKHRIWLNLSDSANVIGQTLVGYATGATYGDDNGFDGKYFNENQTALTSLIGNVEYAVQARSLPFEADDVVPLGFKADLAGTYTITLSNFDGLFETGQDIFLKDNLNNGQLHDLKVSAYSFTSNSGIFNDRFSVVYQSALSVKNPEIDTNNVVIYKHNNDLHINSGSITMQKIELFDIRGRLIYTLDNVNHSSARIENLNIANQVLIVKINSNEDQVFTKKIIY